jgi:hypothetical protein
MSGSLVDSLTGTNVVVANTITGPVNFGPPATPAAELVRPFDVDAEAKGFVGRVAIFDAIDRFAAKHPCGYVEIVGDAGLGKTALAAEIARRRGAIVFFASAGRGTQQAWQLLRHVSAELIVRHLPERTTLPADVDTDSTVMVHLMREAAERSGAPIWVVVDGLDEADRPAPGANPLLLPVDLPAHVYVVVTRRTGTLLTGAGTSMLSQKLKRDDDQQKDDVAAYLRARARDDAIQAALAGTDPPTTVAQFVSALSTKSDGNFAYLSFVVADIAEAGLDDVDDLPDKLVGYYDEFWERMSGAQEDWETWKRLYKPVLERLTVAVEAVTADWLGAQVDLDADEVEMRVLTPWRRLLGRGDGPGTWRFVHRSFADYLESSGKVNADKAHEAVAQVYLASDIDGWDGYGVHHAVTHLAEAATRAKPESRALLAALADLVVDPRLQARQLARVDAAVIERGLERAQALLARAEAPDAGYWLAPVALSLVALRRELLQGAAIFDAARRGEVERATVLLEILGDELDDDWRDALTLTIAWLAAAKAPGEAGALRERVRTRPHGNGARSPFVEQILARAGGLPPAPGLLEAPPPPGEAEEIVARLVEHGVDTPPGIERELLLASGGYTSAIDAPRLVALVVAEPQVGGPLLDRYIAVHAAYGYQQYRSGSLWWLFGAVLADPDGPRAQGLLAAIGAALLAPVRGSFFEAVAIACRTQQAIGGDVAAVAVLDKLHGETLAEARALPAATRTGGRRDRGDLWGTHRRRLAALAESAARRGPQGQRSLALLDAAIQIDGGFSGFTATAYLTLAEAASIVPELDTIDVTHWGRVYAMRAAQTIRDPVYSMRVTARVRAMDKRWWPAPDGDRLAQTIEALAADPTARAFAAVHVVGERLEFRSPDFLDAPTEESTTLRALADLYKRPVEHIDRLNDAGLDDPLPPGTDVAIPDPGFPPLLAARLAAAVLASDLDRPERLIRRLVPVAAGEQTALATTLARLVLASPTTDLARLDDLRALAERHAAAAPTLGGG